MRILVTGATGFVGSALTARLAADRQFYVRTAARGGGAARTGGTATAAVGDIGPTTDWREAVAGADVVIHLAGRAHVMREEVADPLTEYRRVNVDGSLGLARAFAAAGGRRFVYVSSVKVNGETGVFSETDPPRPEDPYGVSKLEAERVLAEWSAEAGTELVIIRPPLVYGPGARANFALLVRAVARGLPLPLGGIANARSLVGLDNLVDFIVTCATHSGAAGETFMVSDGEDVSTPDLVTRIGRALGRRARLFTVPQPLLLAAATAVGRKGMAQRLTQSLRVDSRKATRMLHWRPPLTLDEGLRRAVTAP
jgi:nucleoside-diphosphate-sugar epimerase